MNGNNILNIGYFFVSVLLIQMFFKEQVTYWFLLLTFFGMLLFNMSKYEISINTPEIMQ